MRFASRAFLLLAAVSAAACEQTAPLQPQPHDAIGSPGFSASMGQGAKPVTEATYANGKTVYMIGSHMIPNAATTMPNLYAHAEELYLVAYPQANTPAPGAGPITLPSGYQPQCNPCFHPGLPAPFVYHDHLFTGAPGMGTHGTAGDYVAPWKIIVVMYSPAYVASPTFTPIKSSTDLDAAEAAGNVLLPINAGGANPYEVDTGNLLICPAVSDHA
jgi:hypothetical protein